MRVRSMSAERFFDLSARLLAGAAVLTALGLGLVVRFVWNQAGQSYGPDGTATEVPVRFATRVTMVMTDLTYRQIAVQLLLACALVAAAVVILHRNPAWDQVRRLRWEVLGAGLLVLIPVAGLAFANLYLLTDPVSEDDAAGWFGPQPLTDFLVGNLTVAGASLLVLTAATLGWLRLGPVVADIDDDSDEERDDDLDGTDDVDDAGEQRAAHPSRPPTRSPRDARTQPASGGGEDYRHDWSPEDFRPPN